MTAPHNPYKNGVNERENQSIVGYVRAMLHDQDLSLHLWAEACSKAVYLKNQSPHHILGMITPHDTFLGRKSDVSHFKNFGASVYFHVSMGLQLSMRSIYSISVAYFP